MGLFDKINDVPMESSRDEVQYQPDTPLSPDTAEPDRPSPETGSSSDTADHTPQPRRRRRGCGWIWFFGILMLILAGAFWLRYCNPYVTDAQVRGYVISVERRGMIFKTFEAEMLVQTAMDDTARVYSRDYSFSVPSDSVARLMQSYAGSGRPLLVTYRRYYGSLPWRGASCKVVDSVSPISAPGL